MYRLLLIGSCFAAIFVLASIKGPRQAPLTLEALGFVEQDLGIKLPTSTRSVRTFLRKGHQGEPHLYVKVVFDQADLAGFISDSWLRLGPESGVNTDRHFGPSKPCPDWFDVMPVLPADRFYDRANGTSAIVRSIERAIVVYFEDTQALLNQDALESLSKYPFSEEPLILGPPDLTGVREWP